LFAFALRFDLPLSEPELERAIATLPFLLVLRFVLFDRFGLDSGMWQHVGLRDLVRLTSAVALGSLVFPIALTAFGELHGIPVSVFFLEGVLTVALLSAARLAVRYSHERPHLAATRRGRRTFVVGAGEAGEQLVRQLLHDSRQQYDVVGLVDDDDAKRGRSIHGVSVLGSADDLRWLVGLHRVGLVLIAIPSATPEALRRLVDRAMDAGAEVKLLPPMQNLVTEHVTVNQFREVEIEDLLGRDPVNLDLEPLAPEFAGKVVMVTGAGGSIGSELARQLAGFHPRQLVLVERAESPLYFTHYELATAYPGIDVVPVLASVTNEERLTQVFEQYRPDVVFHAAAYKHVPMLEANVVEGVWNNVIGTLRTARCAARFGARRFVLISTDKAVNPTSILGATKLLAERIVLELPSRRATATDFRVVRFGNVLGSDGSVVPLFKRQLAAGGPITVTHPDVRRYFMTIREAVQLVLQAAILPEAAGRIALLEMGTQVRIVDLAEQLIRLAGLTPHRDVKIVFTGLRPGEKLEEELLAPGEQAVPTSSDKIQVVERNGTQWTVLSQRLRHLVNGSAHDDQTLLRAIATLVPEYQPTPRDVVAHLHNGHGNGNGNGHAVHHGTRNGNGNAAPHGARNGNGNAAPHGARNGNGNGNGQGNGNGNGTRPHRRATSRGGKHPASDVPSPIRVRHDAHGHDR
jgi:FlaA1/EpsC-like NDP-sugar epimerase